MFQKKSLGQNFLTSKSALSAIISASNPTKKDTVLEVGPGKGILTSELLEKAGKVVVVEKDDRLIPVLEQTFEKNVHSGELQIIHDDILNIDPKSLGEKYKVVANIPYYITGQFIRKFLTTTNKPESMTILVQKEVADRAVARDSKESLLSLSIKVFGTPTYIQTVKRGSFSPAPNVDSAILHISNISNKNLEGGSEEKFFELLHLGFAHKRKQLFGNLAEKFSQEKLGLTFDALYLDRKVRAEDVPLEKWIALQKSLY